MPSPCACLLQKEERMSLSGQSRVSGGWKTQEGPIYLGWGVWCHQATLHSPIPNLLLPLPPL